MPFNDAKTTYGGGAVNTQTMGMNPYQQFEPKRMDQLFSLLGQRRPQQQQAAGAPSGSLSHRHEAAPRPQQQEAPQEEWVDAPAMKRLAFGTTSGTTRVKKSSQAAQMTPFGVVGY